MKFIHFTAADGKTVAISTDGEVILRPHLDKAEPDMATTVIDCVAGQLLVRETMAEVEERMSS